MKKATSTSRQSNVRKFVTIESAAIFAFSLFSYAVVGGNWWLFVLLFLAPDISMLGYLLNKKDGANIYNLFHLYMWPFACIVIAFIAENIFIQQLGFIWLAHISLDRALGFGLKYPKSFKDTHLQHL